MIYYIDCIIYIVLYLVYTLACRQYQPWAGCNSGSTGVFIGNFFSTASRWTARCLGTRNGRGRSCTSWFTCRLCL